LKPSVTRKFLTIEDDDYLIELQQKWGNKWNKISSYFKGCSRTTVQNRWYFISRDRTKSQQSNSNLQFKTPPISTILQLTVAEYNISELQEDERSSENVAISLSDEFYAQKDTQLVRHAVNFHRQHQNHKERDPFRLEPFDWSAVLLELGPGRVPIYKFENNKRSVIWPKVETTALTIDNIGFGLLWTILSEEFGWRHFPGSGGCVNDSFKSPVSDVEHSCEFYGNAIDLRLHVKVHGLYGNNNVLMTTSFCFALVNKEGHEMTTLTICKTPLIPIIMTSDESVRIETIYLSCVCEDEYVCFCCDGLMRIGDGSNEKTYC
jgi:hypothetical protein